MILDIGCGSQKRGDVGIDIAAWPGVDHVVMLGFEQFPFPSNQFDKIWSVHSIEHVPFMVWAFVPNEVLAHDLPHPVGRPCLVKSCWERLYPMVQLFRECHRVLKLGGEMEIITICMDQPGGMVDFRIFEDPTHCSFWTLGTIHHFVGGRDSVLGDRNDEMAGLRVPFQLVTCELNSDNLLHIVLRK